MLTVILVAVVVMSVIAIHSLLGAVLLRAAAQMTSGCRVPFGNAFLTNVLSIVTIAGIVFGLGFLLQDSGFKKDDVSVVMMAALVPIGFLVNSGLIAMRTELSIPRACLVTIVMGLLSVTISVFVNTVVFWIEPFSI